MQIDEIYTKIKTESQRIESIAEPPLDIIRDDEPDQVKTIMSYPELMSYDGERFVENLYQAFLGRHSDEEGMIHYLRGLADGSMTKDDVVCGIGLSDEAIAHDAVIAGLDVESQPLDSRKSLKLYFKLVQVFQDVIGQSNLRAYGCE